jgi:hypothetical protein
MRQQHSIRHHMNLEPRKPDEPVAPLLIAMREPPGRLGDIVRRLKQAPSMPPRMDSLMVSSGEVHAK